MRKIKKKKKRKQAPTITWEQEQFLTLYKDVPASEIPDYSLAECVNLLCRGAWAEARPGTRLWAAANLPTLEEEQGFSPGGAPITPLPSLAGRADYVATKSEDVITKTVGQDFTDADVGSYFVWPDGYNDLIVDVLDANRIQARSSAERAAATAEDPAWIRGPINSKPHWHENTRRLFIHIDTRVFYTDYLMRTYTQLYPLSVSAPANVKSDFDSTKDFIYLFANGVFLIDTINLEMYKINEPVPDNHITRVERFRIDGTATEDSYLVPIKNEEYRKGRRYLSSMSHLDGTGFRNRGTLNTAIRKETGTCLLRTGQEYRDYKEVWFRDRPESNDGDYVRVVVGGALADDLDDFISVVEGSFNCPGQVGGGIVTRLVVVHLGAAESFFDIAKIFEDAIRAAFPDADGWPDNPPAVRFVDDHFIFYGGNYDTSLGGGYWTAGTVGTDLGTTLTQMDVGSAALRYYYCSHILGTDVEEALKIKDDQRQWTHYSIYSTRDVDDPVIKDTTYIWQEDVPVAKAFRCERLDEWAGDIVATQGTFERMDIGSVLKFEDGAEVFLRVYVNDKLMYQNPTISVVSPGVLRAQAACIGGGRVGTFNQDGDVVSRVSGDEFLATDVGMLQFWADGTYGYIIEYISSDEVRVLVSVDRTNEAMTWDPQGRNYNDIISDTILAGREEAEGTGTNYFILKQRFWTALPDTPLGVVGPLFMYVSQNAAEKIHYSTMAPGLEYLGGHYDARYQTHAVKDSITAFGEFPDKIIIYCSKATYKIQTNVTNQIKDRANNIVAVISGISVIDGTIGIKYKGAIKTLENGDQIMMTSEPSIRMFNGLRYSPSLSEDEDGKGMIQEDIQTLQNVVSTGWDRLLGFILWGQTQDENVVDFNWCYRRGVKKDQPPNWAELTGQWPSPEPGIGTFDIFDNDDRSITIIFEANSGLPYMIASREGPVGSNITKTFRDKVGGAYDAGYEIPWSGKLKEHRGKREEDLIRHLETHVHLRPQNENNKGASGYDINGFRNAQEITIRAYLEGNVAADAVTNNIPNRGDITFDKMLDAHRFQIEIAGTASEIKITSTDTDYIDEDIRGNPSEREMQEQQYQDKLSDPTFWLSRGDNPMVDRATGNTPSGSIFDFITGPDGDTESAFVFADASELEYAHTGVYGDFTIMFGISNILTSTEVFRIGDATISINLVGDSYMLEFDDGVNTYDAELNWDGSGWALLKIVREGEQIIFSENGAQLDRELLVSVETVSGNITFPVNNSKEVYDVRVYSDNVSDAAFEYYYRDVTESQGVALLW